MMAIVSITITAESAAISVLQFHYDGYCINILDTPGHQDFSVRVVLPASGWEIMAKVLLFSISFAYLDTFFLLSIILFPISIQLFILL